MRNRFVAILFVLRGTDCRLRDRARSYNKPEPSSLHAFGADSGGEKIRKNRFASDGRSY